MRQLWNAGNHALRWMLGAPDYHLGDAMAIVYSGRDCQIKDWPDHKSHCRIMERRKKLLRAANILQGALLTYQDILYDIDLTKIEEKDGILYLYQNQRSITAHVKRGPFPNHLTTNVQHKEAALTINQCTAAMALLGRLTRKLLAGKNSRVCTLLPDPDLKDCPHTVIKVGLLYTTESWTIDTAGCQYGFREVLVLFNKYIADKCCQLLGDPTTHNWTETKDLDCFSTLPIMNKSRAQKHDRELERKARFHFADFVDRHVGADILDGSASEFNDQLATFENMLKTHMLSFDDSQFRTGSQWPAS
ncbi:hypothetical protein H9L39_17938 [Fusarium oxysporum f. sp. albedinis]|nr:hypothetical protein H9L39_17938 [Fusarium oxysporum f. sp. albedinis]